MNLRLAPKLWDSDNGLSKPLGVNIVVNCSNVMILEAFWAANDLNIGTCKWWQDRKILMLRSNEIYLYRIKVILLRRICLWMVYRPP